MHRTELQHTTHQTARLARGKHASPGDGVCVMELASMLGREPFTDSPECASPIVAAFLRAYNDAVDDDARQDLYDYASKVVGTHAAAAVERRRAERCLEVLHGLRGGGLLARLSGPWSLPSSLPGIERLASRVARELQHYGGKARALALADELIAMSAQEPVERPTVSADADELLQLAAAR